MQVIARDDSNYPEELREIGYPPEQLFCEGDVSLLGGKNIAVVGTRRMTSYGQRVTRQFVSDLVKQGWVVVSGLARGVDRVAHETALATSGKTIAVLAHGLDITYPPEHARLRQRIATHGGLVISEYPEGEQLSKQHLVLRNRIVVGISRCVLVTESPKSSGTKITVGYAADQGKDVYVVPGPVDDPTYEGSVELMRDGCIAVSSVWDIQ